MRRSRPHRKGPSRRAIAVFEAIVRDATPKYLDVSARLAEARRAWRATAQPLLSEARDLVAKGMWNEAHPEVQRSPRRRSRAFQLTPRFATPKRKSWRRGSRNVDSAGKRSATTVLWGCNTFGALWRSSQPDDPCYPDAKR